MAPTATDQRRLRLLPILLGTAVDVIGTLVMTTLLTIVVVVLSGAEAFQRRPTAPIMAGWIFFGCTFTMLGAFIAAYMAKRREVMHGLAVAIVGGILSLWSDPSGFPRWFLLSAIVASLLAGAAGGALAAWARGPQSAGDGSHQPPPANVAERRRLALAVGVTMLVAFSAIGIGLSRPPARAQVERVYVVPIHAAPELLARLKAYYRERLGLEMEILPAIQADTASFDSNRRQLIAEEVVALLHARFGELTRDRRGVVIAVTSWDMYPRSRPWGFAFGWRNPPYAVVSYARMHLMNTNELSGDALIFERLRKMVTRYIGMMAYGIRPSADRRSVMYQDIMGLDDLDRIEEDLAAAGFPAQ